MSGPWLTKEDEERHARRLMALLHEPVQKRKRRGAAELWGLTQDDLASMNGGESRGR